MKSFTVSIAALALVIPLEGSSYSLNCELSHSATVITLERAEWYKNSPSPCSDRDSSAEINKLSNGTYQLQSNRIGSQLPSQPGIDGVRLEFVYRVTLRNGSANTIRSVEWDYIFIDPTTQTEVSRHHFNSETKLRPKQRKTLVEYSSSPPTKVISVNTLLQSESNRFIEEVVIRRIIFEDGSICENRSFRQ